MLLIALAVFVIGVNGYPNNVNNRIVNGRDTDIREVPYIVGIHSDNRTYCAGSILNETVVITAAHCIELSNEMYIHAGTTRKTWPILTKVKHYEIHWDAIIEKGVNDVALLFLETPLTFSENIRSIPLVKENHYFDDGTETIIAGWGSKLWGGPMIGTLQSAKVPLINHGECEQLYMDEIHFYVSSIMICAGGIEYGNKGACLGDSGGPLVTNDLLIGVLSMGYYCNFPSIYTNLAHPTVRAFIKYFTNF